jgi:hypothetical protein
MGAVLGEQQDAGDDEEAEQDKSGTRCQDSPLRLISMFMHRHGALLFDN